MKRNPSLDLLTEVELLGRAMRSEETVITTAPTRAQTETAFEIYVREIARAGQDAEARQFKRIPIPARKARRS